MRLFRCEEIPWEQIAFRTIDQTLKFYFLDREAGTFRFHMGDIVRDRDRTEFVQRRYGFPGPVL